MSKDKLTAEQALELLENKREPTLIRHDDGSMTISSLPLGESSAEEFKVLRQALSAPRAPDELRSVVADIRAHCDLPNPETADEVSACYALLWAERIEAALEELD